MNFPPSLRGLFKNPGFSFILVVTLALGIGANAGVFSIVYTVLIQPLPYKDPTRIVALFESKLPNDLVSSDEVSPANFVDWRQRSHSFSEIAASSPWFSYNLTADGPPEHVFGAAVSSNLFPLLGVQPALGRTFLPEEDSFQAPNVVVLSHQLWTRRYGGDRSIINRTISINGDAYTVVGVMPAGWNYPTEDDDIWIPLTHQIHPDRMRWRSSRFLHVIGRLRPGVTLDQARAEMNVISSSIRQANPEPDVDRGVAIVPFHDALVRDVRPNLLLALGVSGVVLLIACTNAANLMLVRVAGKARDLAVRVAIGASPMQVLRQPIVESLWLGSASGVLGIFFALGGKQLMLYLVPDHESQFQMVRLHPAVLAFTFLLSMLAGLTFGLVPAVAILRSGLQNLLRKATRAVTVDLAGRRLRNAIAVGEIALSVLLLAATGLLLRSFMILQHAPLGFNPNHIVTARFAFPRIKYQNDARVQAFYERAMEQVRALPGIEEATLINHFSLNGDTFSANVGVVGKMPADEYESVELRITDAPYFSVLSIPMVQGRTFTEHDRAGSELVAIVNQAFVRHFLSGQDATGKQLTIVRGDDSQPRHIFNIVGVASNVRNDVAAEAPPTVYVPHAQMPFHTMGVVIRTRLPLVDVERSLQSAVQKIDPSQTVYEVSALEDSVRDAFEPWRYALLLLGVLAALALVLTIVGLFAVISNLVRERTKELGIRIALGATRRNVVITVLGLGLRLTAIGLVLGLIAAIALTPLLGSLLYGVSSSDPETFAAVALVLGATALLASYMPARRAALTDALAALGDE